MKVLRLKLRGFKGIRAGMGIDEIDIDFAKLPDGVVAITGENGGGKTTLLDNIHPYRLMPYKMRKSPGWSPGGFSYYDQCFGSDALKELVFSLGGEVYMSRILIDAERKKQEAYLYRGGLCVGDWIPLNDGKTRTYDEAVENLVGSPSLFFTSVFRSQGARNLSDYTRGDIMGILGELLNTDHIREQGEKCRAAVGELNNDLATVRRRKIQVDTNLLGEAEILVDLAAAKDAASLIDVARVDTQLLLTEARNEIVNLSRQVAEREAASARVVELQGRISEQDAAMRDLAVRYDGDLRSLKDTAAKREAELSGLVAACRHDQIVLSHDFDVEVSRLKLRAETLNRNIASAQMIIAKADDIRSAAMRFGVLSGTVNGLRMNREVSESKLAEIKKRDDERRAAENDVFALSRLAENIKSERERKAAVAGQKHEAAKKTASLLDFLDCHGDGSGWVNESCSLLTQAIAAKESLGDLWLEHSGYLIPTEEEQRCAAQIADKQAAVAGLAVDPEYRAAVETGYREETAAIKSAEAELATMQDALVNLAGLENAEATCSALVAELAQIDDEIETRRTAMLGRLSGLETHQYELERALRGYQEQSAEDSNALVLRHNELLAECAGKRDSLSSLMAAAQASLGPDPADKLRQSEGDVTMLERRLADHDRERQAAAGRIGGLEEKLKALAPLRAEAAGLVQREGLLNAEIADLSLLAKACSNDGLIALELDDAAPSISAIVNQLLSECYGPRFAVRLDTQAARADGTMKEAFDILVFDSEADAEASITEKSGGQVTFIEDAIVRGMCLFNIHRSDRVFASLFSDEKDGALSEENKRAFLAVKRKALELGTHQQEYFISQTQELTDMADARIMVGRGGVTIQ